MKRFVKSATFEKLDVVNVMKDITANLKRLLPTRCRYFTNPQYTELKVIHCPDKAALANAVKKLLTELGYTVFDTPREEYDMAAVNGNAFCAIWVDDVKWDDYCVIDLNCDHGNVIFEDWYDESVVANTQIKASSDRELPAGYLKTTKFSTPSIKTDDQRNALEALEIAISEKFKQFDDFMNRQAYLTSETSWTGKIREYIEGYLITLEGTRSGFQAFVQGDKVIRKPRLLSKCRGEYDVDGNEGQVYWMSRNKIKPEDLLVEAGRRIYDAITSHESSCSFDFAHDGYYKASDIDRAVNIACDAANVVLLGTDYREVDYSQYHEYDDVVVSQCGFDFEWSSNAPYVAEVIEDTLAKELQAISCELIGIDFYSRED